MIHKLNISWNIAFVICLVITGLVALVQQCLLDEGGSEESAERDKLEYLKEVKDRLSIFLEKRIHKLWLIDIIAT